jgi:acyl-CoA synthetase (NDP forming)
VSISTIEKLFRPKSVAIIGASANPAKTAGRPLRFLRKYGFSGNIWPVNPQSSEIDGVPCFSSVDDLPAAPDASIILLGPAGTEDAVRKLSALGARASIVVAGGYGETGAAGTKRQVTLSEAAKSMRVLGPNTIGLLNLQDRIILSASGALDTEYITTGKIGVISQSGGILGSLLSRAAAKGIGLSHLAATGNEGDLEVCDILEWMINETETSVITLYLEGLRNTKRFKLLANAASRAGKHLVVYKVGKSDAGALASASHTGAMAGDDRLYDALFAQSGVIRVDRFDDLLDIAMALSTGKKTKGGRVGILTSTGGAGSLVADRCGLVGLTTPIPSRKTAARLGSLLRHVGFIANRNPIDLTLAGLTPEIVRGSFTALLEAKEYDIVVPIIGSSAVGRPELIAEPLIQAANDISKPLIVYCSPDAPDILYRLNSAGIPSYAAPESCAEALKALRKG